MQTVITGASGLLGGNLALELLERGHRVRATRRGSSRVEHLTGRPIEWVDADLGDEAALAAAFRGSDVVFHCAALVSIRRRVTPELVATNVDGTRRVLAAAAGRVGRVVHCSTVGAVGLSENGRPCTEAARWNFPERGLADGYVTTKHLAEEVAREAAGRMDVVIANPTYMLGPYDAKPSSGRLIVEIAQGRVPGWTPGLNNFVDVRDVARGMVLVAERGRRGERYILGGENLTYRDVMQRIARIAGVEPPRRQVPPTVARVLGWVGDLYELVATREPLINSVSVAYGYCTTFQFTSERAERELGYRHGPIEPAIADAVAWFRAHGILPAR